MLALKADPLWRFNEGLNRYQLSREGARVTGQRPGTMVGRPKMIQYRNEYVDQQKERVGELSRQLRDGDITLNQWVLSSREAIKETYINQYLLGVGGRGNMTQADYGRIGNMLANQYGFLQNFALDIQNGRYDESETGIEARLKMYIESSTQAWERAQIVANYGGNLYDKIPQFPGDGRTQCRANCRCNLIVKEVDDAWLVTWKLNPAEHCGDCDKLSKLWKPLRIPK